MRVALFAALVFIAAPARADDAKRDFDLGMKLMQEKRFDDACDAFGRSDAAAPTMATKFQLGRCNEARHRYATARYDFIECAKLADAAGDKTRADAARQRVAEAEKRTPHLRLQVAPVDGERIVANGMDIPPDKWSQPLYVDPGKIALEASAPGRKPFNFDIDTSEPGAEIGVAIPELVPTDARAERPVGRPQGERVRRSPAMFGTGIALVSVGGVSLVAGAAFLAANQVECGGSLNCPVSAPGLAFVIGGIVCLGAGIPLAVIGGRKVPPPAAALHPWVSPTLAGLALSGSF